MPRDVASHAVPPVPDGPVGAADGSGGLRHPHHGWSARRGEIVLHAFAAVLGPLVATLVVGAFVATLVWRTAAIAVALTLVVRALIVAAGLVRAEWRRTAPPMRTHLFVAARFLAAFLLIVVATA